MNRSQRPVRIEAKLGPRNCWESRTWNYPENQSETPFRGLLTTRSAVRARPGEPGEVLGFAPAVKQLGWDGAIGRRSGSGSPGIAHSARPGAAQWKLSPPCGCGGFRGARLSRGSGAYLPQGIREVADLEGLDLGVVWRGSERPRRVWRQVFIARRGDLVRKRDRRRTLCAGGASRPLVCTLFTTHVSYAIGGRIAKLEPGARTR